MGRRDGERGGGRAQAVAAVRRRILVNRHSGTWRRSSLLKSRGRNPSLPLVGRTFREGERRAGATWGTAARAGRERIS